MAVKTWKKHKILGVGSYGKVHLAAPAHSSLVDTPSALLAAVKSADVYHSKTLQEERLFLDKLSGNPNILRCFGDDISKENGGLVYNLLLEYAPGGSLNDLIKKNKGTIPETLVACYTLMLLEGVSAIHEEDIVHCDIKPGNILVFPDGENGINLLKIADFGLAKKAYKSCNGFKGTTLYASPEAVMFGLQEKSYDIWSLGCTVSEMITGERIWTSCKDVRELSSKIMCEKPKIPENISKEGKDFLERCLTREVSKRWTADMLIDHPFIVKNMRLLLGNHDHLAPNGCCNPVVADRCSLINPFGSIRWNSSIDLFSS